MYLIYLLSFLVKIVICVEQNVSHVPVVSGYNRNFIYNLYKYNETYSVIVNSTTQQILDYYEDSEEWCGFPTRVLVSTPDAVNSSYPLFITATQQKGKGGLLCFGKKERKT
ncbi:hypothetical protein JYU34_021615 [Plutella xylostella]|uniref:Uncharacterized protein n=1 Tax=Plutella xylostella TaxID=51655 RepID=A0ABQ7PR26_PLUXY|nr:hypothetical protein JYU34_021615 [Plutella xylostella]